MNAVAPGIIETTFGGENPAVDADRKETLFVDEASLPEPDAEALDWNIPMDRLGTPEDLAGAYPLSWRGTTALRSAVDLDKGLSIVVDAGNGTSTVTADALRDLCCSVTTLNGEHDGRLAGRPSEPTADHCGDLYAVVAGSDADFGVAHDGDADRMMAVTEAGEFVAGDVCWRFSAGGTPSRGPTSPRR